MRNVIFQAIPAGTTLTVPIEPPMQPGEVPFAFTATGQGSVVIRVVDSRKVAIHNPTDHVSPFLFFVGNRPTALPAWLQTAMRLLGGT